MKLNQLILLHYTALQGISAGEIQAVKFINADFLPYIFSIFVIFAMFIALALFRRMNIALNITVIVALAAISITSLLGTLNRDSNGEKRPNVVDQSISGDVGEPNRGAHGADVNPSDSTATQSRIADPILQIFEGGQIDSKSYPYAAGVNEHFYFINEEQALLEVNGEDPSNRLDLAFELQRFKFNSCLLYTSPSPRD